MKASSQRKLRGMILDQAIFGMILLMILSYGFITLYSGQFSMLDASRTALQAQQYADSRAQEIGVTSYGNLSSVAETRTAIGSTGFDREVIVGSEVDLGGGSKKRDITVNIYKIGETQSRFSLLKTLSTQGSGSLPTGSIILWSGYISTIPVGFQLCNGTNGSPDLRNRFVVGAGVDIGTHIPNGVGGIGSGYFAPGNWGGEEMHRLTVAEMPSHNHTLTAGIDTGDAGKGSYKFLSKSVPGAEPLNSSGGDQAHNIMPPYYSLAYIMKL